MNCNYEPATLVCVRCNHKAKSLPTHRRCDYGRQFVPVGDAVERMLATLGITKERVQKWTRKECQCPARQRWLNQWGFRKQEQLERVLRKAARWYGIS